jgi:periplasmic protein CpxP/Spy
MNKRNLVIGSILAVSLLAGAGVAGARGMGGRSGDGPAPFGAMGPGMGHGGPHGALRGVDLTDEQRDKVFDIQYAQQPAMRDRMKEMTRSREEIGKLVASKSFDVKRVRELAGAQAKIMTDLIVLHAETDNKIYNLLTPEQQKQYADAAPGMRGGQRR